MTVHRGYAAVSFGQIHYRYAGAGDKPVLVLLHQTPSTSEMFEGLMLELASDFRVLAPDSPGMGLSDAIPGELTIPAMAAAIAEFLDEISVDHYFAFGHHTGASIAAELAAAYPEVVTAVALSGPPLLDDALKARLVEVSRTIPQDRGGEHFAAMWQRIAAKDTDAPLAITTRETINGILQAERYSAAYDAVIGHDFDAAASAIQCPALVFAGTEDPLFGQLEAAKQLLNNGAMRSIDGARTFVCETHQGEVANLLREFFPREAA